MKKLFKLGTLGLSTPREHTENVEWMVGHTRPRRGWGPWTRSSWPPTHGLPLRPPGPVSPTKNQPGWHNLRVSVLLSGLVLVSIHEWNELVRDAFWRPTDPWSWPGVSLVASGPRENCPEVPGETQRRCARERPGRGQCTGGDEACLLLPHQANSSRSCCSRANSW